MLKLWNCVLALSVSALMLSPVMAEDAKPKRPKAGAARKEHSAVQLPKGIELTDEQKSKVAELEKEFAPKMKELREKLDKVLTEDQKKARAEATKEARTGGKTKRKESQQAIKDATKATDEQQKQIDEVEKQITALRHQIREKVEPILTEEQKAKLTPKRGEKKKKIK